MRNRTTYRFTSNSRQWAEAQERACGLAVKDALLQIEGRAAERAPVDTGSLRASIYVEWSGVSAGSLRPAPSSQSQFGAAPLVQTTPLHGYAAVGVEYGLFVHEGHLAVRPGGSTRNRRSGLAAMRVLDRAAGTWVPARPFLRDAGEEIGDRFLQHILPHYLGRA